MSTGIVKNVITKNQHDYLRVSQHSCIACTIIVMVIIMIKIVCFITVITILFELFHQRTEQRLNQNPLTPRAENTKIITIILSSHFHYRHYPVPQPPIIRYQSQTYLYMSMLPIHRRMLECLIGNSVAITVAALAGRLINDDRPGGEGEGTSGHACATSHLLIPNAALTINAAQRGTVVHIIQRRTSVNTTRSHRIARYSLIFHARQVNSSYNDTTTEYFGRRVDGVLCRKDKSQ